MTILRKNVNYIILLNILSTDTRIDNIACYIILVVIGDSLMKNNNISPISFGTKTTIGYFMADIGLRKYDEPLSTGILDAFKTLSNNGVKDSLNLHLGVNAKQKDLGEIEILKTDKGTTFNVPEKFYNDTLVISYTPDGTRMPQSSMALDPKKLAKLSKETVSKVIQKVYDKLKISHKYEGAVLGLPYQKPGMKLYKSPSQEKAIETLTDFFVTDDSHLVLD